MQSSRQGPHENPFDLSSRTNLPIPCGQISRTEPRKKRTEIDHASWNNKQLLLKRKLGLVLQKCN